ncbi:MAG: Mrp/NBP35 family ATP-binding protein [Candidatus Eisenbacteria bacterium]|nr:Mrp/NBP35 family ATP-binding protein [Candidatus Eisenbacteria bacterium]
MLTEAAVRAALSEVSYPGLGRDIVALGIVRAVMVNNDRVHVSLALSTARADVPELLRTAIRERLRQAGSLGTEVQILTPGQSKLAGDPWADRGRLPNVRRVVAVGAGKGGVGKSTVAVNLAMALQSEGLRVGILDADIYGPSVPVLVGLEDGARQVRLSEQKLIIPLEALGLRVVSFGFFLGAESPVIWRGPVVAKTMKQLSRGVLWPELDVLVVDLPPGTGDVPLSLAQSIVVDGAVVVTTPQRLAVLEAAKAIEMFRKLGVPLLGVVENMAYASCSCGRRSHPFGAGGGAKLAREAGVPLLGEVPFEEATVTDGDCGEPAVRPSRATPTAEAFRGIAARVAEALTRTDEEPAPRPAAVQ